MEQIKSLLLATFFSLFTVSAMACSPCGALSNVTQNINGTDLELTFTSTAGWDCCYTVEIEIVCENTSFTGIPNYFSAEICLNGGLNQSTTNTLVTDYPLTVIDISGFCPGTYKWRAAETVCAIYTPEMTFVVPGGGMPIILNATQDETEICEGDPVQLDATASGGCFNNTYDFVWAPATGLSNANIANPIATPTTTTTYTVTASESGACSAVETFDITIDVNPLPTATITGTVDVCQDDPSPDVILTGADGTAPYTIDYTLNGTPQTAVVTTGNTATIPAPTGTPGVYTYEITNVSDATSTACSQAQTGSVVVTVNDLPVVDAGGDQILCEPNGVTPSEVTLNGSGATSYTWDNGAVDGVPFTPPSGSTIFTVTGTDANGCQNTDWLEVVALTLPVANGSADGVYGNADYLVNFTNSSMYATNYTWDFGDNNTIQTTGLEGVSNTYLTPGIYDVLLTASNGICWDTWTIQIEVLPPMVVTPPNIFTPNGDGNNDVYYVNVEYGEDFEGVILNRWGNVITEVNGINASWDGNTDNGNPVAEGVYFVKYVATDFGGKIVEGHNFFHLER